MKQPFHISIEPKTRFPLVVVPGTNYALTWFPVTKIQIEYFLCETMNSLFDRSWYRERLKNSPRVATELLTADNVRQAFITNLSFYEVCTLSRWWGNNVDLPTLEEWHKAFSIFEQMGVSDDFVEEVVAMPDLHPRARLLLQHVEQVLRNEPRPGRMPVRPFSQHLLMRSGILEYVYKDGARSACAACGSFHRFSRGVHTFDEEFVTPLHRADTGERRSNLGFRLLVRNPG